MAGRDPILLIQKMSHLAGHMSAVWFLVSAQRDGLATCKLVHSSFSCLSPVRPGVLGKILSNSNLAVLTENFLCFHMLKEKGRFRLGFGGPPMAVLRLV